MFVFITQHSLPHFHYQIAGHGPKIPFHLASREVWDGTNAGQMQEHERSMEEAKRRLLFSSFRAPLDLSTRGTLVEIVRGSPYPPQPWLMISKPETTSNTTQNVPQGEEMGSKQPLFIFSYGCLQSTEKARIFWGHLSIPFLLTMRESQRVHDS